MDLLYKKRMALTRLNKFRPILPCKFCLLNWFRSANFIVSRESAGFVSDPEEGKVFRRYIHGVYDSTANRSVCQLTILKLGAQKLGRFYSRFNCSGAPAYLDGSESVSSSDAISSIANQSMQDRANHPKLRIVTCELRTREFKRRTIKYGGLKESCERNSLAFKFFSSFLSFSRFSFSFFFTLRCRAHACLIK